jgi:hypothetical protein
MNIYLSNASTGFNQLLKKHKLTNVFDTWSIYAWDTNSSYDKVDWFVKKNIQIIDMKWKVCLDVDSDIVRISKLAKWEYIMNISYTLDVPSNYISQMHQFEKKYGVKLTDRELWILAMQPTEFDDPKYWKVYKWRETKSTVYFPKNITVSDVQWETYYRKRFEPDFANWLFYQMGINTNNTSKTIKIQIKIE